MRRILGQLIKVLDLTGKSAKQGESDRADARVDSWKSSWKFIGGSSPRVDK